MSGLSVIVLGGTGLIGSAIRGRLIRDGQSVISINRQNYSQFVGTRADLLINCNGNPYRYKAEKDPRWDFEVSVTSVEKSLFDFQVDRYFYFSSIDVYNQSDDPELNGEEAVIDPQALHPYGFHKWLAERLVEKFATDYLILRCGTVLSPRVKKGPLFDLVHNEPLRVSIDSEFSLIESETMAAVVAALADASNSESAARRRRSSPLRILNLTGTGSTSLRRLCVAADVSWQMATGAAQVHFRYDINNARLREMLPVPNSHGAGMRYLRSALQLRPYSQTRKGTRPNAEG